MGAGTDRVEPERFVATFLAHPRTFHETFNVHARRVAVASQVVKRSPFVRRELRLKKPGQVIAISGADPRSVDRGATTT